MPAAMSHYLLADRLLKEETIGCLVGNQNAFLWGAQGPDVFYCHRFLPWQRGDSLKEYDSKIHATPPDVTLEAMRQYDRKRGERNTHDYILGFLSHYALDSVVHPFVFYSAAMLQPLIKLSTQQTCRYAVESMLDVILLRYERSALPTELRLKRLVPKDQGVKESVAGLYGALFCQIYHEEIAAPLLEQCMEDCRTAFGWMTDRTSLKKQWIARREKKKQSPPVLSCHIRSMTEEDDFDYGNVLSGEWRWPLDHGLARTDRFIDLVDQAQEFAQQLIMDYERGERLAPLTKGRPF